MCADEVLAGVGTGIRQEVVGTGHMGTQAAGSPSPPCQVPSPGAGLGKLTTLFFGLIRAIPAVVLSITLPARRDTAARVLAAEFIHSTGHLGCKGVAQ